jgi:hypothetical protein
MTLGLALPPLLYFVFSMTSGINIGMRHILPVYPFLYVGAAAWLSTRSNWRPGVYVMASLAALHRRKRTNCARLSRVLQRTGRRSGRGPEYLVDSNIDWGRTSSWDSGSTPTMAENGAPAFSISATPNALLRNRRNGLPEPLDQKGWDAIDEYCVASVTPLQGVYVPLDSLAPLRMREPVAKIGWSMWSHCISRRPPPRHAIRLTSP